MNRVIQKLILILTLFISILAKAQLLTVSAPQQVPNPGVPIYPGFPDGHITFKSLGTNMYFHVWTGYDSYITSGTDILHQAISKKSFRIVDGDYWIEACPYKINGTYYK